MNTPNKIIDPEMLDADNPEWTDAMFENATFGQAVAVRNRGGRPKSDNPKQATTIRLSPEVLAYFKRDGKGWQTRINNALLAFVAKNS